MNLRAGTNKLITGSLLLLAVCAASLKAVGEAGGRQDAEITSEDGFVLRGSYFSPGRSGPGVLLLHQCNRRGALTGYEGMAPMLAAEGFHVLMLDSRGFGRSRDDRYRDYHAQMDLIDAKVGADVEAAFRFLLSRSGVDRTSAAVVAASCGTWQSIPLAAAHPEIRALVFISGSYLDLDDVVNVYESLTDRPILAIYSEGDRYRTPESMRTAFAKSRHPASKLIAYKGNLHGAPLLELDDDLERQIAEWLGARLRVD